MFFKILRPILKFVSPTFVWKRECPVEPEKVVSDFIRNRLTKQGQDYLSRLSFDKLQRDETLAHRRRIASIYGIAKEYDCPNGGPSRPSWNLELIRNCGGVKPDLVVERIFQLVWEEIHARRSETPQGS